jgi:hypothetical protein
VLVGVDVRASHDLPRVKRDAQPIRGKFTRANRHKPASLAGPDPGPRGRPVCVVSENLLDNAYYFAVGACYSRAE